MKILVVEDERIIAEDIRFRLEDMGHTVTAIASSGEESVQKVAETKPDLVLMDIVLKGDMDGIEAAGQIRNRFNVPAIYVTSHGEKNIFQRTKETRPFGYILKPLQDVQFSIAIEIAIELYRAERELLHHAFHDALTNLPNRALFMDRLEHLIKRAKRHQDYLFAVLVVDLDRFKVINESLGHIMGDKLLIAIAQRLTARLFSRDTVARFGGDEFVILLEEIKNPADAIRIADKLHRELKQSFNLDGHKVFVTASIGIALSVTGYGYPEDILRDADMAMYRAKAQGKACYEVFDSEMHVQAMKRLRLENQLRRAIERDEFVAFYQPIVCLETGHIVGFEALVRWEHPDDGLIPTSEFIPVAEETGMIVAIDRWMLGEACRQMAMWKHQFAHDLSPFVSVNFSSQQFTESDLVSHIEQTLRENGLHAYNLKLEVTESAIMRNPNIAMDALQKLEAMKVGLSIDDFGTGYSSLSYLHSFPFNTLKIDRSFVSRMGLDKEISAIVQAIVILAHNLGMDVVAEGIETLDQAAQLEALNCELGQGYFFSKPINEKVVTEMLQSSPDSKIPRRN